MRRDIIIDTDPGQDDAVAILLALASEELNVLGLTCVAGNVPLERTSYNARQVCELAGRADLPVFGGCDRPMVDTFITEVSQDTWIFFPWDMALQYVQPYRGTD